MKIALLCIAFFLANGVDSRSTYLKGNNILQELLKKYVREEVMNKYKDQNNFKDFEDSDIWKGDLSEGQQYKSEYEHEDLFGNENGNKAKDQEDIDRADISDILSEKPQEILNDNVEYNSENQHKDLFEKENEIEGSGEEGVDPADISDILREKSQEILNNNVEYNSEDQHKDLFEKGNENEGSGEEGAVPLTPDEANAMNNYQGDEMIISEEDKKRGVGTGITLWPRMKGKLQIPYVIDCSILKKTEVKKYIGAMNDHLRTCNSDKSDVWVEKTYQQHFIRFRGAGGCYSYLGYTKRANQTIGLANNGCIYKATVLHEMLHAMGFSHEQSRSDRDKYVTINYGNIKTGFQHNFKKLSAMRPESATDYDYKSVMHYSAYAFSKNNQKTIVAKDTRVTQLGNRYDMTATDIAEVKSVYRCATSTTTPSPTTSDTTLIKCDYSQKCSNTYSYKWTLNSGYLRTKSYAYQVAYIYKSRYPKIPTLNKCNCTSNCNCPMLYYCVQFTYTFTNATFNKVYNALWLNGYTTQTYISGRRAYFFTESIYAPGGSGLKTMKTTIGLNCGSFMALYLRTASRQKYEVKMDNFIIKYGKC